LELLNERDCVGEGEKSLPVQIILNDRSNILARAGAKYDATSLHWQRLRNATKYVLQIQRFLNQGGNSPFSLRNGSKSKSALRIIAELFRSRRELRDLTDRKIQHVAAQCIFFRLSTSKRNATKTLET